MYKQASFSSVSLPHQSWNRQIDVHAALVSIRNITASSLKPSMKTSNSKQRLKEIKFKINTIKSDTCTNDNLRETVHTNRQFLKQSVSVLGL